MELQSGTNRCARRADGDTSSQASPKAKRAPCATTGHGLPGFVQFRSLSEYDDKRLPSLYSMEKIAWILVTKTAGRQIGFVSAKEFRKIEGEDAEITP